MFCRLLRVVISVECQISSTMEVISDTLGVFSFGRNHHFFRGYVSFRECTFAFTCEVMIGSSGWEVMIDSYMTWCRFEASGVFMPVDSPFPKTSLKHFCPWFFRAFLQTTKKDICTFQTSIFEGKLASFRRKGKENQQKKDLRNGGMTFSTTITITIIL